MAKKSRWELTLVLLSIGCFNHVESSYADTKAAGTEIARVNNTVITLEEFNREYEKNTRFFQLRAPSKESVLDDLIKRKLGIQRAESLGLNENPKFVERKNTLLYHLLLEEELTKDFEKIHVTDSEAESYYKEHPEIRTSHIFVALKPDATPAQRSEAYKRIQEIYEKNLADGQMSFAEVAQRFSDGPEAPMGGDINFQPPERLDPKYYEAALKLGSPGKVSKIVETPIGYHIIKLTAIRPWDEVDKAQVKRIVFEVKRTKIFEDYMNGLLAKAKVTKHPELLKK